ncbi:MAG TPA: mechanosensitive ion channel family protein [Verrucomicrobiota bacterium]|nr:mechanosensitive ion channel family protein [Verrucomicrobiota bacterium]HRZ34896.1 mechanosensitive ion channel family protein [Candidatus Paceibacterota bacterium]
MNAYRPESSRHSLCALSAAAPVAIGIAGLVVTLAVQAAGTNGLDAAAAAGAASPAPETHAVWSAFGLDRVAWLQTKVLGNPLWQYIASLLYVILAFYAAKLVDRIFQGALKSVTARTTTKFDDLLVELARGPVKVVVFVVLLHIGLHLFQWPDYANTFLSTGLKIVVACSLTYVAVRIVDLAMGEWQRRVEATQEALLDKQLFPVIRKSLKTFVVIVAILVTTQNLGVNVTGLLASLSIGGLAVGLAAQDTLSNLFGAVAVFVDKPFRVGDRVQLDNLDGTVEAIGLRSTRVRNLDGHLVTIPNRTVANAAITNISKRPNIKTVMNIGITYDTPPEKVQRALRILEDVYRGHPMTADVLLSFNKFADCSLNLLVIHWWNSTVYKDYLAGLQAMNLAIKERFDAEKIEFAFPTRTIYVKQEGTE